MVPLVKLVMSVWKAAAPCGWLGLVGAELWSQPDAVPGWSVVPQYMVTVGLIPPVVTTFPLMVAVVWVIRVAGLNVIFEVVKLRVDEDQLVPAELLAAARK